MIDPAGYQSHSLYSGESRTAGSMPVYSAEKSAAGRPAENFSGSEGHGFMSFLLGLLDVINPLQHIPVVSSIYRHLTGDEISPMARIAGDTLYGGPVGAALAFADVAIEKTTGSDLGENVIALLDNKDKPASDTMLASRYNGLSPAAGAADPADIIWTTPAYANTVNGTRLALLDAQELSSSPKPTLLPHRTGEAGTEPVGHSTSTTQPVPQTKSGFSGVAPLTAATESTGKETPASYRMDSTAVLLSQEAPDDAARMAAPPGLIAPAKVGKTAAPSGLIAPAEISARMMEALDKYSAMKKAGL